MVDIKSIREAIGLSQTELADRLGVTQPVVSRFESGSRPINKRTQMAIKLMVAEDAARKLGA